MTDSDRSFLVAGGVQGTNSSSRDKLLVDFTWNSCLFRDHNEKKFITLKYEFSTLSEIAETKKLKPFSSNIGVSSRTAEAPAREAPRRDEGLNMITFYCLQMEHFSVSNEACWW